MINFKNNDNKCFLWYHVEHLNQPNKNPQKIIKKDKKLVDSLDYKSPFTDIVYNILVVK